jgi:hypothetical protein
VRGVIHTQEVDGKVILTTRCPQCQSTQEITVSHQELFNYRNGAFIQNAFRKLTASQREALLTGYCDKCWDEIFGED